MSVAIQHILEESAGVAGLFSLVHRIEQKHPAIVAGHQSFAGIHETIMELENHVFSSDSDRSSEAAILENMTPERMARMTDAYCFWETRLEEQFAKEVIQGRAQPSQYLLYDRFHHLLRKELALVPGPIPERILFIGSGPFPITAMHLHLQTGSRVDCVDRDSDAVAISREVMKKCDFSDSIQIFCGRGEGFDVSNYDLILIALLAKPKARIIGNLRKSGKRNCKVLCRTSFGLRQLVYEATADRDLRGFHVSNKQVAVGEQTISTLLMEKAENVAGDVRLVWLSGVDDSIATQLLRLMNRVLEEETTIGFPGPIDPEGGMSLMRQLKEDVHSQRRHVLIAQKDDQIVGQLVLTPNRLHNCSHIVELSCGIIDRSFRGAGLAARAFDEVVRKCENSGREIICLDVRAGTTAAMWWSHFGFQPFGTLDDYARVGEKRYKGLFMTQTVSDLKRRLAEISREPVGVSVASQSA